jgi:hypothetical protein
VDAHTDFSGRNVDVKRAGCRCGDGVAGNSNLLAICGIQVSFAQFDAGGLASE